MTNEEAIEILLEEKRWAQQPHYVKVALDKVIEALEKQIPKKPTDICTSGTITFMGKCPKCGDYVITVMKFCGDCGQAIDWSDDE